MASSVEKVLGRQFKRLWVPIEVAKGSATECARTPRASGGACFILTGSKSGSVAKHRLCMCACAVFEDEQASRPSRANLAQRVQAYPKPNSGIGTIRAKRTIAFHWCINAR